MRIRTHDTVRVISGNERGKTGKVLRLAEGDRAVVEGLNFVWKHMRRSQQHPHGARIQKEAPIHVAKLMLVCSSCGKPTRISTKRLDSGEKVRVCKKCKATIAAGTV
ncbi:MAG: 50S ribosomal protein L24 [Planctomycetes bacterium]|nr:50S ribosomal protein L24 [Planctomycetota bacterium]